MMKTTGKWFKPSKNGKGENLRTSKALRVSNLGSSLDMKKIPKNKQFNKEISVFCQKELECYYQTLLKFCRGDISKYREGL